MASLCPILGSDSIYLMMELILYIKKVLIGMTDSVLVEPPNKLQRDRNIANAAYNVISSKAKTDLAKVSDEFMKPETHKQVFRFSY